MAIYVVHLFILPYVNSQINRIPTIIQEVLSTVTFFYLLLCFLFLQAKSALMLSPRKLFPATENPWQHVYNPDVKGSVDFKMLNSLIGVVLLGTLLGWTGSTYVPLLPGWLGALGSAVFLAYLGTLKDAMGDMLRWETEAVRVRVIEVKSPNFIPSVSTLIAGATAIKIFLYFSFSASRFVGHSLDGYLAYLFSVSKDVLLLDKASVLFQRIFSIILRFEKKNKIIEKLTFYFGKIILLLTSFFKRYQSPVTHND